MDAYLRQKVSYASQERKQTLWSFFDFWIFKLDINSILKRDLQNVLKYFINLNKVPKLRYIINELKNRFNNWWIKGPTETIKSNITFYYFFVYRIDPEALLGSDSTSTKSSVKFVSPASSGINTVKPFYNKTNRGQITMCFNSPSTQRRHIY